MTSPTLALSHARPSRVRCKTRFGITQGLDGDYPMRMSELRNIDGFEQAEDFLEAFSLAFISGHYDGGNIETNVLAKTRILVVIRVFTV